MSCGKNDTTAVINFLKMLDVNWITKLETKENKKAEEKVMKEMIESKESANDEI